MLLVDFLPQRRKKCFVIHTTMASESDINPVFSICVGTVLSVMCVFSISGNLLVCLAVYRNRRLRTVANSYVISLALVDLLETLLSRPFGVGAIFLGRWPFGHNFCQFNGFLVYYWCIVSISTLAMTAVNRYLCLFKPEKYKNIFTKERAILALVLLWIVILLLGFVITYCAPFTFEYSHGVLFCRAKVDNRYTQLTFLVFSIFFTILPMATTFYCYGKVFYIIRQHIRRVTPILRGPSSSLHFSAEEIKTTRVLFITVAGFCLCWTPLTFLAIIWYAAKFPLPLILVNSFALCSASSSFINPIIYGIMNRAMRKEFTKILCC